jgi:hypothetical protein
VNVAVVVKQPLTAAQMKEGMGTAALQELLAKEDWGTIEKEKRTRIIEINGKEHPIDQLTSEITDSITDGVEYDRVMVFIEENK